MTPVCEPMTETMAPRSKGISVRVQLALAGCACAGAAAFIFAVDPNHHAVYPQCVLYHATGIYCAGCGATRALHALFHGRILEALHDNALFMITLPLLLYVLGGQAVRAWQKNAWPTFAVDETRLVRRTIGILLVMLVFMILRNLPGWPFVWLKPLTN